MGFVYLGEAPRDPILVPSTREERVNPINPLFLSNFWADNALSLITTTLTRACFLGGDNIVMANSHACSCTRNAQECMYVGADTARALLGESSS